MATSMYPMLCMESNNHPLGATTTVNECQSVILCPIAENILRPIAENVLYPPERIPEDTWNSSGKFCPTMSFQLCSMV